MKKVLVIAVLFLFMLAACKPTVSIQQTSPEPSATTEPSAAQVPVKTKYAPEFTVIQSYAKRYPPAINGTVKNTGNATGSVKLTARVYYAQVVSSEKIATYRDVKPEETRSFAFSIEQTTQWTSYSVIAETID
jgi:hypothetical protein